MLFTEFKLAKLINSQIQNLDSKFKLYCLLLIEGGQDKFDISNEKITFEWRKNGRPLTPSNEAHYRIESHLDESSLTIPKLTAEDSGNYSCLVFDNLKNQHDQQTTHLTVKGWSLIGMCQE